MEIPAGASSGVIAIDAGRSHVLALKSDGSVLAWGEDWGYGHLDVPPEALSGVVAISASARNSVALKSDGSVIAWGSPDTGLNDVPAAARQGVVPISAGENHGLALKSDGSVVQWGWNYEQPNVVPAEALSGVTTISAGPYHSMASKADGTIVIWTQHSNTPCWFTRIVRNAVAVAGGYQSCQVLLNDGSVISESWPDGLNNGPFPVPPAAQSGVVSVSSGYNHNLAIKADGTAFGWGHNADSQATVPAKYRDVMAVAPGKDFSIILLE
ncbi:hypothetical protein SK803_24685 [Lentzea sp. BCCO 10_0856]|uniref:Regulator of chromosome condensation (RCC1) repeat-containing protein n=1 Tax=Lentzea miocenica TaxID=3095431 RepID=A0ABU4T663_9PSEU|nr:hypothetical protein [Lentzea sp. BCCO 10_0856]MDX8033428.1 hypothetical protein [Lentzea sp. BCCO 10_0856]